MRAQSYVTKRYLAVGRPQVTCVERIGPILFRAECDSLAASHSSDNSRRGTEKMVDCAELSVSKMAGRIDLCYKQGIVWNIHLRV